MMNKVMLAVMLTGTGYLLGTVAAAIAAYGRKWYWWWRLEQVRRESDRLDLELLEQGVDPWDPKHPWNTEARWKDPGLR